MTRSRIRATLVLAGAAAVASALGSCANAQPAPEPAKLDRDNVQIELPADAYGMNWREADLVRHARELHADACMRKLGERNWNAEAWSPEAPPMPDWRYGRWNADYVAKHGYEGKKWRPGQAASEKNEQMIEKNPELLDKLVECGRSAGLEVIDGEASDTGGTPNPIMAANEMSYQKVFKDSRVHDIWREVGECTEAAGFAIEYEGGFPGVKFGDDWSDEQVRKADVAKAACDDKLNATQRIADIEAGYQQQYIDEREAEFVAVREQVDKMLAKADEIIENHG